MSLPNNLFGSPIWEITLILLLHGGWNQSDKAIKWANTELTKKNCWNWNQMIGKSFRSIIKTYTRPKFGKQPEPPKQKPQAPIVQPGKIHMNTKVDNERQGSAFKQPPTKFDINPSTTRTKSPKRMNKQLNTQGSTKSLNWFYCIESMDSEMDRINALNINLRWLTSHKCQLF